MKKSILSILLLAFVILTGCEEESELPAIQKFTNEESITPLSIKTRKFEGNIDDLAKKYKVNSFASASCNNEVDCSDEAAIQAYISCSSPNWSFDFFLLTNYGLSYTEFTFNVGYFTDANGNIDLDQSDIPDQISWMTDQFRLPSFPNPNIGIAGDTQNWPCNNQSVNNGVVRYIVVHYDMY